MSVAPNSTASCWRGLVPAHGDDLLRAELLGRQDGQQPDRAVTDHRDRLGWAGLGGHGTEPAGLKGAVPIPLGSFLLTAEVPDTTRLYAVIVVVVVFSVVVQGGLVPTVAARLGVPMRTVEPEPWSLGVRFRQEPRGLRRHVAAAASPADGCRIGDLGVGEDVWISFVIRDDQLVPVGGATSLRAGDEILALTDPERGPDLTAIFSKPGTGPAPA
jgi:cell volume regulation protein A